MLRRGPTGPAESAFLAAAIDALVNRPITGYGYAEAFWAETLSTSAQIRKKSSLNCYKPKRSDSCGQLVVLGVGRSPLAAGPIKFHRRQNSFRFLAVRNYRPASSGEPNYPHE